MLFIDSIESGAPYWDGTGVLTVMYSTCHILILPSIAFSNDDDLRPPACDNSLLSLLCPRLGPKLNDTLEAHLTKMPTGNALQSTFDRVLAILDQGEAFIVKECHTVHWLVSPRL